MEIPCLQCGAKSPLGAIFCRSCGAKLDINNMRPTVTHKAKKGLNMFMVRRIVNLVITGLLILFIALLLMGAPMPENDVPEAARVEQLHKALFNRLNIETLPPADKMVFGKLKEISLSPGELSAILQRDLDKGYADAEPAIDPETLTYAARRLHVSFLEGERIRLTVVSKLKVAGLSKELCASATYRFVNGDDGVTCELVGIKHGKLGIPGFASGPVLNNIRNAILREGDNPAAMLATISKMEIASDQLIISFKPVASLKSLPGAAPATGRALSKAEKEGFTAQLFTRFKAESRNDMDAVARIVPDEFYDFMAKQRKQPKKTPAQYAAELKRIPSSRGEATSLKVSKYSKLYPVKGGTQELFLAYAETKYVQGQTEGPIMGVRTVGSTQWFITGMTGPDLATEDMRDGSGIYVLYPDAPKGILMGNDLSGSDTTFTEGSSTAPAPAAPAPAASGVAPASGRELTEAEKKEIGTQMEQFFVDGFNNGKFELLTQRTHPAFFKATGKSPELNTKQLQAMQPANIKAGYKILAVPCEQFSKIYPVSGQSEELCIYTVATRYVMNGKEQTVKSLQLAIRSVGGHEWRFIDGYTLQMSPAVLQKYFPDAPAIPIPKT